MATTTVAAVRDEQLSLIEGITPASVADVPFRRALEDVPFDDFRDWAARNAAGSLRRFAIADAFDYGEPLSASNQDVEFETATLELVVAYPNTAVYGADNRRDRDDVIREDKAAIDTRIGHRGNSNYTADAAVSRVSANIELGDDVTFLVMRFHVHFWEAF